ncbi:MULTISPECIES: sigma-70 family RNA polymerase sigma factor [Cyanophyceae]|uniref:sigma-70 family RNA polymerase sigma factor n=1 Tax=Cyanophyceae TaxID=3028117 RepID=UPI00168706A9|nr:MULTISPECIES: sigma-70 family RNA polymerase sigma factor [unclassified Phormidium]MBD1918874.1 sigma-70 family RNA polymerase sigma factor [Phormidium sp. FACHB-77]MBD2033284.1 sigma-70 family RNA polymerase sigma factor [Phormidium sp. FACHB-322]MBD2053783.1 sigma-70 family RNA polymerase sigma factor [Leptolyngbya sp. FACHB-60]
MNKPPVETAWATLRNAQAGAKQPPLALALFRSYKANPNQRLRDRLVVANMGLVEKVARRFTHQCQVEFEDLRQEGAIGLTRAVEEFDPEKGYAFSSFAIPKIRSEIMHYMRDKGWGQVRPPRRTVEDYAKVKGTQRRLTAMGRPMPADEVAEGLGFTGAQWKFIETAREQPAPISLDDSPIELEAEAAPEEAGQAWIFERLAELPQQQYECVVESVFGQLADEAIARRKKLEPAAVRALITAGLESLKTQVEGRKHG